MYNYSKTSKKRLEQCSESLQRLFNEVIKEIDITILCGHRGKEEQNKAFREGKSQLKYPYSEHNKFPSDAVDTAPYPIDWQDIERFKEMGEIVKRTAKKLGIDITWGGDWKSFKDYPHFQLRSK